MALTSYPIAFGIDIQHSTFGVFDRRLFDILRHSAFGIRHSAFGIRH